MPPARVTQTGAELAGEPLEKPCVKESPNADLCLWQGEWIQWPGKGETLCLASRASLIHFPLIRLAHDLDPLK